jgi:hypothetical protein
MSEPKLSLPERALLLILMATNAELSNPEIEKDYAPGLKLTGKSRAKLADAKLIDCRKGLRGAFYFRLADAGWAWCREELAGESQKQDGSAGRALYAVLGGVGRYLDRTGRSLADIFGGLPEEAPAPTSISALAADEIDLEIRRTYRKLAGPAGSWVGLADIRDHLGDIARTEVDGVLRLMVRMPGIRIEEETNQKSLSQRDREAAVTIGNRAQHVLAIDAA